MELVAEGLKPSGYAGSQQQPWGRLEISVPLPPVLNAAATNKDRFVDHAIIYSLITLRSTAPLIAALKSPSSSVRKSALIALDQMDGSVLSKENLVPFFE